MPCCVIALLAILGPRIVLVLLWLFDNAYLSRAFNNFIIPLLGFLLLPWTTLAYAFSFNTFPGGVLFGLDTTGLIIVIVGFVIDLIAHGVCGYGNRGRFRR